MTVFSPEFIDAERRRARGRPEWHRSAIHDVICSDEKAELRAWIESEIRRLPEPGRAQLARRLRLERHFLSAVHELAVAAVLADCGLAPTYEAELEGQTPDLFVPEDGSGRPLIVEAWTREMEQRVRGEDRAWGALRARIERIPVPVGLLVEPRGRSRAPSSNQAKVHAASLGDWLLRAYRPAGSRIELDGFRYVVHGPIPGLYARLPPQHSGGTYDTSEVLNAIGSKVTKYRDVAVEIDASLLVVVGADLRAPLTVDLLRSALLGKNSGSMSWSGGQTGYIGEWTTRMRSDENPPELDGALSAVGWIEVREGDPLLRVFQMESALAPISLTGPRIKYEEL